VVNAAGGAVNKSLPRGILQRVRERYGIKVVDTSPTDFGKLRAMVQSGQHRVVCPWINEADAERAIKMNLLEPLDFKVVNLAGHPKEIRTANSSSPAASIPRYSVTGRTYSPRVRGRELGRVLGREDLPGPRSLRNSPVDNLEFALMADGIAPEKLYPLDVDRAFRKLDQIKPHISVWWTTGAQSAQVLIDKEVVLATAWHGRFFAAIKGRCAHCDGFQSRTDPPHSVLYSEGRQGCVLGPALPRLLTETAAAGQIRQT